MIGPQSVASDAQVFWRSLALVGVAELFDKTWFMGLLLALRYPPVVVFIGSFLALFLHCFFAAAFGLAFARLVPQSVLNFLAAGLFATFAVLYAKDWYGADPNSDAIAAGREGAAEDCGLDVEHKPQVVGNAGSGTQLEKDMDIETLSNTAEFEKKELVTWNDNNEQARSLADARTQSLGTRIAFTKSFTGVFIAEWGDRTQIAMIGQHASQPLVPVFFGSALAFFFLTLSAVGLAAVASKLQLSERTVHGVGAVSFALFAVLALRDSVLALSAT